ncbi:MAG TPA: ATP-binding protein [Chthoniobacteraceae bacterium]|nr:ATP-binding protein [Chthoniobacteraceae bacterium]
MKRLSPKALLRPLLDAFRVVRRGPYTVGYRLTLWYSIIFVLGSLTVFGVAYFAFGHLIDEQTRDSISFRLHQFAREYQRGGTPAVIELCRVRRGSAQQPFFVRIATPDNRTLFVRDAEDWSEFPPEQVRSVSDGRNIAWQVVKGVEGSSMQLASWHAGDGVTIQVGRVLENRFELLDRFQQLLIAMAGFVILVGVGGGAAVVYRALRPVRQLTETVDSLLSEGSFSTRVPSRGTGDEIDELVECLNQMLDKIELLVRGMRDSLDNVAHDLRTPMTRLRNMATEALEHDYDKKECQEALGDCLEESERVLMMLSTLMDIAEAETGVVRLRREPVDVGELVAQMVDLYQHVAEERQITLEINVAPGLVLNGDAGRLQRALGNLLDNALKYTRRGGRVVLSASGQGNLVTIEVADNGVGIPPEELARIWERLYRVDKSRSQRGLGLGLSFVKAIIEAHRGTVHVISEPEKGSCFIVRFPVIRHSLRRG